jgi:ParB-like chromosome segregation protein Spo0J
MELKVDPEFKAAIQPLSQEELAQLEANIKANGCRDPLVIWDGVIVDGHHRYEICQRLDIPFHTVSMDFPDRAAAKVWMLNNQL